MWGQVSVPILEKSELGLVARIEGRSKEFQNLSSVL